jgi:hypothetical protein
MSAPTSEVGYTSATSRWGDHEVYMDMWEKKKRWKKYAKHNTIIYKTVPYLKCQSENMAIVVILVVI